MTAEVIPLTTPKRKPTKFEFTKTELNKRIAAADVGKPHLWRDTVTNGLILKHQRRDWMLGIERRIDGKLWRISLGEYGTSTNLRDVRAEAETIMGNIRSGTYLPAKIEAAQNAAAVADKSMTLGEAFQMHMRVNPALRQASRDAYAYGLLRLTSDDVCRDADGKADPVGTAEAIALPIRHLKTDQIRTCYDRLCRDKSPASANAMLRAVRAIWTTWADETDYDGRNPVSRITAKRGRVVKAEPRTGALTPDQRKPWYQALERMARTSASHNTARALQVIFLTGLRRDEVLAMTWAEVGTDSLTVGAERMKAGTPLTRPITAEMRRILDHQRKMNPNSRWVFPASRGNGCLTDTRKTLVKLPTLVTNHDLRRTFIVAGELSGVPQVAIKLLVGHSTSDITDVYAKAIKSELPRLAEVVESELLK